MDFVYGVIGAAAVLILFFGGVFAGWKLRAYDEKRVLRRQAAELSEKERRALEEQQEAFRLMQGYSAEMAYGMRPADEKRRGEQT